MPDITATLPHAERRSRLDRMLSLFGDVHAGEGVTAVLLLANVFLLLVCYSVIKTVREPLILLGGGAEVRSYAAAGQALLLMGLVPLYSALASRVDRLRLITAVTLFFVVCIELFALGVAARVPFVGVAFFIWVGIFNISLVAQFWSFANDIYRKDVGTRLFPIVMVGMTAGAPLGSLAAARLFRAGVSPQLILQVSALLLLSSLALYFWIDRRQGLRTPAPSDPLAPGSGFALVAGSRYLQLIAALVIVLNIVNTTGEYVVAKMLTSHVARLASIDPTLDRQAFIGAFSGEYQFWVNVAALLLQGFAASRLVRFGGLTAALLALPIIAVGGYALIAAGASFTLVRWIKTAENATDYSIMNTARQLLWLPTSREEKYKAKQAIDTFAVRAGDVLSAGVVYIGAAVLHIAPGQFAIANVVFALVWIGLALRIARPEAPEPVQSAGASRTLRHAVATVAILLVAAPLSAQDAPPAPSSRAAELAAARAKKAANLEPYEPVALERRLAALDRLMFTPRTFGAYIGGVMQGGGLALGPAVRKPFGDTALFTAHAAWSIRSYAAVDANMRLPEMARGRLRVDVHGERLHAPAVAFFGLGNDSARADRRSFGLDTWSAGVASRFQATRLLSAGAGLALLQTDARGVPAAISTDAEAGSAVGAGPGPAAGAGTGTGTGTVGRLDPAYRRTSIFAAIDTRDWPAYTRHGSLLKVDLSDYAQINGGGHSFRRADAEVQHYIPLSNIGHVIALRAVGSATITQGSDTVPFFLLPDLGGPNALRGYPAWRLRDRHRLLLSTEYRWAAGPVIDMAVFLDAGKVTSRAGDLSLGDLRTSYGIGFNIHTPQATVTRIALARTSEGLGFVLSFTPGF
ncbi:MAG: BamA/TamA family outer membrane protein [Vicinamibacterales bacterium]